MTSNRPPQLLFDDGSRVMTEEDSNEEQGGSSIIERGSTPIRVYYEIDRIAQEIREGLGDDDDGCRVALQFPNNLLADAPMVCWEMEQALSDPLVFVVGDATFGSSCCPDEVTALHLEADVLVHYGHACLSPTVLLPVIYSFGVSTTDESVAKECVDKVTRKLTEETNDAPKQHLLVLYQLKYHSIMNQLESEFQKRDQFNVIMGQIPSNNGSRREGFCSMGGLEVPKMDYGTCVVLFVGDEEDDCMRRALMRLVSAYRQPIAYWRYAPGNVLCVVDIGPVQKWLGRRFYAIQKARSHARVFGILVGTLSQRHFDRVVSRLRRTILDARRACYTFCVGRIQTTKLANFAEVECFVLVSCPETSLLRDAYHVPVITPWELNVALGNTEWGDDENPYSLDYNDFLQTTTTRTNDDNDDAPLFSLVSGRYQDQRTFDQEKIKTEEGGQVVVYKSQATEFLRQREYQGLENSNGPLEDVHAAAPGRVGIASNYTEQP